MIKSIQHFGEEIISKLENEFLKNLWKLDEYVIGVKKELWQFGLFMEQEEVDKMI